MRGNDFMKFNFAKVTNSRLMGSMGLIINWNNEDDKIFCQYFLLDSEGLGIADYVSLEDPSGHEVYREEERLMGGLGSDKIRISEDEARFLVSFYGKKNEYYNKDLPGDTEEYIDIIEKYSGDLKIEDMYPKICKEIVDEIEFVNYMTMRFIAWDREGLMYYSASEEISSMHVTKINGTLLKTIVKSMGNSRYISTAIYEDVDGYYSCKIAFSIEKDIHQRRGFKLNSLLITDVEEVLDFEVFDEISKPEYVSIYNIKNVDAFEKDFHEENPFLFKSFMDNGNLYTRFSFNNDHVKESEYVINNDIKAIYYFSEEELFVGTYSKEDNEFINEAIEFNHSDSVELMDSYYFEQNALYDFAESGSKDFNDFLN
ncbi:hypothetical protein [Metaclostridioides mangenotii]